MAVTSRAAVAGVGLVVALLSGCNPLNLSASCGKAGQRDLDTAVEWVVERVPELIDDGGISDCDSGGGYVRLLLHPGQPEGLLKSLEQLDECSELDSEAMACDPKSVDHPFYVRADLRLGERMNGKWRVEVGLIE